nr:BTAD domain-containing putative transcriptional regulator [Planosporangium flavigriseum]
MRQDGRSMALGTAKCRAVLAALALEANRPVSLERLGKALWAGSPPRSAVANIRTYVAALRRFLGNRIVAGNGGYRLRVEPGEFDVDEFVRLAENGRAALAAHDAAAAVAHLGDALALWRGAPGEGLPRGTALDTYLTGLVEQRLAVFEDLVGARLALGEHAEVIGELRRHLAQHPLREGAWAQLMLALYRSGDTGAALAAYHEMRTLLGEQLGVEPGPQVQALHRDILGRAPELSVASTPAAAPSTLGGPPRQLPPADAVFVGRRQELAQLVDALRAAGRRGPAAVMVSGPGGVGKSTLAVKVAHLVADDFPDGQVYVDLRDLHAAGPAVASAEILASVLRALGVPAREVPDRPDERASRCRSLLAEARVLVLLDNVTDAAQVRPLIPAGSASVLLVTARRPLLTVDAGRHVPLGVLPDDDARLLVAELAGGSRVTADPANAAVLVRLCANLPLALRIVGARLASRPAWPLDVLVRQLADERHRLDALTYGDLSVRDCIDIGYHEVAADDETAARVFRLLGSLPSGQVSVKEAARLLDVPFVRAWQALERLLDAHLVDSLSPERYRLPDLVRQYAAELTAADGAQLPAFRVGGRQATGAAPIAV